VSVPSKVHAPTKRLNNSMSSVSGPEASSSSAMGELMTADVREGPALRGPGGQQLTRVLHACRGSQRRSVREIREQKHRALLDVERLAQPANREALPGEDPSARSEASD
jgi:hypothetical protein